MAESGGNSPEMISDSSIDDDSMILVSRPQNKRSTVVDDESISDSSNYDDHDELNNATEPTETDNFNVNLVLDTDHVSSMSAFDEYIDTTSHSIEGRQVSCDTKISSVAARTGPFSLITPGKIDTSVNSASTDRIGPFASTNIRPGSTLNSEASAQPVSSVSFDHPITLPSSSIVIASVIESHCALAISIPVTTAVTVTVPVEPIAEASSARVAPCVGQVVNVSILATAVVAAAAIPLKSIVEAGRTIIKPIIPVASKSITSIATKSVTSIRPTPISTTATIGAVQPMVSVRARSGSVDLTLEKQQSGPERTNVSHNLSSSSGQNCTIRSVIRTNSSGAKEEEKESAERWRDRLWPSRALTSFCRSITRCKPPILEAGKNIFAGSNNRDGDKKVRLDPHWEKTDLRKVITSYDTLAAHNAAFFLLLVEESRESSLQDSSEFEASVVRKQSESNNWAAAQVLQVVSEMKVPVSTTSSLSQSQQPYKSHSDPRLGSVWVVRLALSPFIKNPYGKDKDGNICNNNYEQGAMSDFFGSGDILLLHCNGLERPLLGIVQIWDPDFESKFGGSLSNNSHKSSSGPRGNLIDSNGRDTVNVLICVDSGSKDTVDSELGGWAPQGLVVEGLVISGLCSLGNVLTSIRECQALMSLRSLSKSLQEVILCGGGIVSNVKDIENNDQNTEIIERNNIGNISNSSSSSSSSSSSNNSNDCKIVSLSSSLLSNKSNFNNTSNSSNSNNNNIDGLKCPQSLPSALWSALASQYNSSQLKAIHAVCLTSPTPSLTGGLAMNPSVTLLQGPPGTGKTRTILAIAAALLAGGGSVQKKTGSKVIAGASLRNPGSSASAAPPASTSFAASLSLAAKKIRVLVCGPSNTAVDELAFRLHTQGVLGSDGKRLGDMSVVRIGIVGGRRDKDNEGFNGRQGSRQTVQEASQMTSVVERLSLDYLVDEKRKLIYHEHGGYGEDRGGGTRPMNIMDIRKQILERADIVCCTLSGAGSQPILEVVMRIPGFKFDAVIIDEAAQAVEPSALIPFKFNPHRVVMVGDPCQLSATVFSRLAKDANYGQSLFQRLHLAGYPVLMLETQYRMHRSIAEYPSQRFYEGKLCTDRTVAESGSHDKPYHTHPSGKFGPVVLHNVSYGTQTVEGTSMSNRDEALYVLALYESLYELYPSHRSGIGIIAPYKSQRKLLKSLFRDRFGPSMSNVEISTIDGFQGREKDIVIFTCVRAPGHGKHHSTYGGIGFLREWQRLNVAITRAKFAIWIVGHADTLASDSEWKHLIDFTREKSYLLDVPIPQKIQNQNPGHGRNKHKGNNNYYNNNGNRNFNNAKNDNRNKNQSFNKSDNSNSNNDRNRNNNINYNNDTSGKIKNEIEEINSSNNNKDIGSSLPQQQQQQQQQQHEHLKRKREEEDMK